MGEIIGDYLNVEPRKFLVLMSLRLFPEALPIQWSQCGATANFLASYFSTFLADRLSATPSTSPPRATPAVYERGAMSYILNELIENAVKYNEGGTIHIQVGILSNELLFVVENESSRSTIEQLKPRLQELLVGDPAELFLQRIEATAQDPEGNGSGLGFVTMMNDYEAKLGWHIEPTSANPERVLFSTMARVPVYAGELSSGFEG